MASDFIGSIYDGRAVTLDGLDELVFKLHANSNISMDLCKVIIRSFFQEIRTSMLKGDVVSLRGFGSFYVSSPLVTGNKVQVFAKFDPHKGLMDKLNE